MLNRFKASDFLDYQSWFEDPLLDARLGPMDTEWLDCVLSEEDGAQYVYRESNEMLAVIGLKWATESHPMHVITDIAVRPSRKGEGIGRKALTAIINANRQQPIKQWAAYVESNNVEAHHFFTALGWERGEEKEEMVLRRLTV